METMEHLLPLLFCYNCCWWIIKTQTKIVKQREQSVQDHHLLYRFLQGEEERVMVIWMPSSPSLVGRRCPEESYKSGNWTIPFAPHFLWHEYLIYSLSYSFKSREEKFRLLSSAARRRRQSLARIASNTGEDHPPHSHSLSLPFSSCPLCAPIPPSCPSPLASTIRSTRYLSTQQPNFTRMSP